LPLAARAVARAWTRSGMLRIFVEPIRPDTIAPGAVGIVVLIEPFADGVRAAAKAKGQVWRLHLAVAHAAQLEAVD
jgi:hypothetical protein